MKATNYHNEIEEFTVGQTITHVDDEGAMHLGRVDEVEGDSLRIVFTDGDEGWEKANTCFASGENTTTETKHTPTPWRLQPIGGDLFIDGKGPEFICDMLRGGADENRIAVVDSNAAFIVRACNSHYELVEALEGLLREVGTHIGKRNVRKHYSLMVYEEAARKAIAKATA